MAKSYLTPGQEKFAAVLASRTGMDRNAIRAWVLAEMSSSYAQGREREGNHNWLNVGYFDSGAADWAKKQFKNPVQAANLTYDFLKGKRFGAAQGIRDILKSAGKDPGTQLKAIWTSPWASSHYNNGSSLQGTYRLVSGTKAPDVPEASVSSRSPVKGLSVASAARQYGGGDFLSTLMAGSTTGGQRAFGEALNALVRTPPQSSVVDPNVAKGVKLETDTPLGRTDGETLPGVVALAKKYLGTPYSWGGGTTKGPGKGFGRGANTVGFDCSSFIQFVYAKYGINVPRVTYDQVKQGKKVGRDGLRAGDAVFFAKGGDVGHVGMYIGNGKFIHAPKTGDVIKISNLDDPYYSQHFYGGRRYV